MPAILFSRPKQAKAIVFHDPWHTIVSVFNGGTQTATLSTELSNLGLHVKEIAWEVLKEVARTFAKRLLAQMTQATVNWINTGFHGSPLFLENPESFFKDIAKYEVQNFVNQIGYDPLHLPFGKGIALNTIDSYKRKLEDNAQYTLSKVINDPVLLNNYRNDFNIGGWNGFLINTQYPQNNYIGFQMMATEELARRLQGTTQNAAQKVQTVLDQGMGFLSPQICPTNSAYNNDINEFLQPSFDEKEYDDAHPYDPPQPDPGSDQNVLDYIKKYNLDYSNAKTEWAKTNDCPGGLVSTTPGSVVGNQISKALGSSIDKTTLAAAVGGSISAILDSLLNKFFGLVTEKTTGNLTGYGGLTDPEVRNFNEPPPLTGKPGTCVTGGANGILMPDLETEADCVALGGVWTLSTGTIPPPLIGICTLANGGTSETTQVDCNVIEGIWTTTTPPLGWCITTGNGIAETTQNDCSNVNGIWSLTPPMGTCDITDATTGSITSSNTTPNECSSDGGVWTPDSQ